MSVILVGQFDSPFVRRVAIAMHHHGIAFERRILSVFKDFDAMLDVNPLGKVPSLILDDGDVLFDSRAIIDYLDGIAPVERRLLPDKQPDRRRVQRIEVIGIGLAEKIYERGIEVNRRAPGKSDPAWCERLETQIGSACRWLEELTPSPWLFGDRFSRADLAVAVALQYLARVLPHHEALSSCPMLQTHRTHCENLEVFQRAMDSADEARASGWRPQSTR